MKRIRVGRRQIPVIVDSSFVLPRGSISVNTKGYPVVATYTMGIVTRKYLHRLIMGVDDPKLVVDHKNGNPLDNRKCNLRVCTLEENSRNRKRGGGVWQGKDGKWNARWQHLKVKRYLGAFKTKQEAIEACEADKKRLRGAFYRAA